MPGCAKTLFILVVFIGSLLLDEFLGSDGMITAFGLILCVVLLLTGKGNTATDDPDERTPLRSSAPTPDIAVLHAEILRLRADVEHLKQQLARLDPDTAASAAASPPASPTAAPHAQSPLRPAPASAALPLRIPAANLANPSRQAPTPPLPDNATSAETPIPIPTPASTRQLPPLPEKPAKADALAPTSAIPAADAPSWLTRFFQDNLLVKAGIAILFLGLAFLLRFASERIVISLPLRYFGVVAAAAVLGGFGWHLRHKRRDYALAIQGAAVAILYLTALAALKLHQLIDPTTAFILMTAAAALMVALALKQDARILAHIALLGGLASPVLTASGSNHYIALFSYLALLNSAVAVIARFKAWRSLNLIGFAGTVLIASLWGERYYQPDNLPSLLPFLAYHLVLYTLIVYFHALHARDDDREQSNIADDAGLAELFRHYTSGMARIGTLDAGLLFASAFTAFSLLYAMLRPFPDAPAFAALAFALYYALAAVLTARRQIAVFSHALAMLAVLFATSSIPLLLDPQWTVIGWSVQAACIYSFAVRSHSPLGRLFALTVYALAALALLPHIRLSDTDPLLTGPVFPLLLNIGGAIAILVQRWRQAAPALWEQRALRGVIFFAALALILLPLIVLPAIWAAVAMAGAALLPAVYGIRRQEDFLALPSIVLPLLAVPLALYAHAQGYADLPHLLMSLSLCSAFTAASARLLHRQNAFLPQQGGWLLLVLATVTLAYVLYRFPALSSLLATLHASSVVILTFAVLVALARFLHWRQATWLTFAYLPLLATTLTPLLLGNHQHDAWLALLIFALSLHLAILLQARRASLPTPTLMLVHGAGFNLFVFAFTCLAVSTFGIPWQADNAWLLPVLLAVALLALYLLSLPAVQTLTQDWRAAYHGIFALPVLVFVLGAVLLWNLLSSGRAPPLPYIPVLNPLELTSLLALWLCCRWWQKSDLPRYGGRALSPGLPLALALVLLVTLTLLRIWHHYLGVPWHLPSLFSSFGVQASLSLLWASAAIVLMLGGKARGARPWWFAGAALMGAVVIKLFLVDLGDSGGIARIISFIGVGVLLLLVGYFAPIPEKDKS